MSAERAKQLHIKTLMLPVHFEASLDRGQKATASERLYPVLDAEEPIYLSASLASLHDKRESGCLAAVVDFSSALLIVICTDMGRQLLVPSSGTDLLTPRRACGSAGWLQLHLDFEDAARPAKQDFRPFEHALASA